MSAGGDTQWPTAFGSSSGPEAIPDSTTLERLLLARFEIQQFITEGVNPPAVSRWFLRVARPDSASVLHASYWRLRGRLVAVATREDSAARARIKNGATSSADVSETFEMRVQPATGSLRWYSLSGGNEGGASYDVDEIDSTGFHGPWEDGGIGIAFVQRGEVSTLERMRGFYCARRVQ